MKHLRASLAVAAAAAVAIACASVPLSGRHKNGPHPSLGVLRDKPAGYMDISAQHRVSPTNLKGWQWPAIETVGWDVILPDAERQAKAGAKLLFMWEVTGQCEGIGSCMAWTSRDTVMRGWSDKMRMTWPFTLAKLRAMGLEPVWYTGCASNIYGGECGAERPYDATYRKKLVDDVAFVRSLGIMCVALDAFSWVIEVNEPFASSVLSELRSAPRTKDMTFLTEGQLPANLTDPRRAFYLRHMGVLELARGGPGKLAINDHNLARIDDARDDRIMPGHVRFIWFHGSQWASDDTAAVYEWLKRTGSQPIDNRIFGDWK